MRMTPNLAILLAAVCAAQDIQLKVAAVQLRSTYRVAHNEKRILDILDQLAASGVKVAVFPECALTGYHVNAVMEPGAGEIGDAEAAIAGKCRERRIAAVFGSVYKTNGKAFDSAVVFDSRGNLVERYGKLMLAGEKWATPGNHIAYFDLEGVPSTVIICHDERYPEFVRLPAMAGARIVYYVSSESGLRDESKLAPYRAQMMARAVENGLYVVAANTPANPDLTGSHGQSRIIDTDGNVRKEASFFGEDILIDSLTIKSGRLTRPMQGVTGDWWREGLTWMLKNRDRKLE